MTTRRQRTPGRAKAPAKAKPETIDSSEMAYHRTLIDRMHEAQTAQAEIARLQQLVAAANGAFQSWAVHLHEKYGLLPGEGVDEEGRITRAPANGSPPPSTGA